MCIALDCVGPLLMVQARYIYSAWSVALQRLFLFRVLSLLEAGLLTWGKDEYGVWWTRIGGGIHDVDT